MVAQNPRYMRHTSPIRRLPYLPSDFVKGRSLKSGKVELVERATHQSQEILVEEVLSTLKDLIEKALT